MFGQLQPVSCKLGLNIAPDLYENYLTLILVAAGPKNWRQSPTESWKKRLQEVSLTFQEI